MDERQQQIREGAGLNESRLNTDFIDLLRKYSTPLLVIIAAAAVAYWGLNRWQQAKVHRTDEAFEQLTSALQSKSPDSLVAVAADYSNVGAVPILPGLPRRRFHLVAFRTGVAPGTQLNPDGTIAPDPTVVKAADGTTPPGVGLTEAERTTHLDQAAKLYGDVLSSTKDVAGMPIQAINSLFGLAAVAECKGDLAAAGGYYKQIEDRAALAGFVDLGTIAKNRSGSLESIKEPVKLYDLSQLPKPPAPPVAAPTSATPGAIELPGGIIATPVSGPPPSGVPVDPPAPQPEAPKAPETPRDSTGPVKRASRTRSS